MTDNLPVPIDANGLTLEERTLLQQVALDGSLRTAAKALGLTNRQVRKMFENPDLKKEYDSLYRPEELDYAKREIDLIAGDVGAILEEAKNATQYKTYNLTCPHCGESFNEKLEVIAWGARLKLVEMLTKISGIWQDKRAIEVKGEVRSTNVNVSLPNLTAAEFIAMERLRMGERIPSHIHQRLVDKLEPSGVEVPALPVLDGSYREVGDE